MKIAIAAVTLLVSATLFAESHRFKKAVESYATNDKFLEAEKEMKGRDFQLTTALAAHRYLNEYFAKENRKILIADVHSRDEHQPWIENFPEGEHIWQAIEEGWMGEDKYIMILIRASNAEFIIKTKGVEPGGIVNDGAAPHRD